MAAYDLAAYFPEQVDEGDIIALHVAARGLTLSAIYADPVQDTDLSFPIILKKNNVVVGTVTLGPDPAYISIRPSIVLKKGDRFTATAGASASGSAVAMSFKGDVGGLAVVDYDVNGAIPGAMTRNSPLIHAVSTRYFTITGGRTSYSESPGGTNNASLQKNGVEVAVLEIGGTNQMVGGPITIIPGDTISIIPPDVGGIIDVSITLTGVLDEPLVNTNQKALTGINRKPVAGEFEVNIKDAVYAQIVANRMGVDLVSSVEIAEAVVGQLVATRMFADLTGTVTVVDAPAAGQVTVDVDGADVPTTMTDYPLYIPIGDAAYDDLFAVGAANGDDIRAKDELDNPLALEIVTNAAGDPLSAFVKTTLDSTTGATVVLYQDVGAGKPAAGSTYGSIAVWTGYAFVSHDGGFTDSKGSTMTPSTITQVEATGELDIASDWTGLFTVGHIQSDSELNVFAATSKQTIQIISDRDTNDNSRYMLGTTTAGWSTAGWNIYNRVEPGADLAYNVTGTAIRKGTDPVDAAFHKWEVVNDAGSVEIFLDDVSVGTDTGVSPNDDGGLFHVGQPNTDLYPFNGYMDEIRISANALSNDWRSVEYDNQFNPATFLTVS